MLLLWTRGLFLGSQASLYVVYVKSYLHETNFHYGLFMTTISLGCIVGALLALQFSKRLRNIKVIIFGLAVNYVVIISLGFVHTYYLALGLIFLGFAAFIVSAIALHSVRDTSTDRNIRGTIYGTVISIGSPLSLFSMLAGSWLARRYGVDLVFVFGGTMALASMALIVGLNKFSFKH
jgi:MFS family permease